MEKKKSDRKRNEFCSDPNNIKPAEKYIVSSENYEGIYKIKAVDPLIKIDRADKSIYRSGDDKISIDKYCHLIATWLMLNPSMLSVSEYYMYPKDNAPYLYTLTQVIEYDSDEIYNILQERIKLLMLKGKIPREAALSVLRECYGWDRPDNNLNVNFQSEVAFRFGGAIPETKQPDEEK